MSEFNEAALIESIGGEVIKTSSLNTVTETNPEKVETPVTPETPATPVVEAKVETPVVTPEKVETPAPVTEAKPVEAVIEKQPETEAKGWDVIESVDSAFKDKYGVSIIDAREIANTDFTAWEETDIIEEALRVSTPDISDREIRAKMRPYDVLFLDATEQEQLIQDGKYTRDQIEDLNANFDGWKRESLGLLNKVQGDMKSHLDEFKVTHNKTENKEAEALKTLTAQANQFLTSYSTEKIEIRDGENVIDSIDFSLNETDKKAVSEILNDPSFIYKMWMDEKGLDVAKMVRDIAFLRDREKVLKTMYNQALAKGASKEIKDMSNITFDKSGQPIHQTNNGIPNDIMAQVRGELGL